jgi:hypothetical protein
VHHKRTAPTEVGAIQQTHSTAYDLDYGHAAYMAASEREYARGRRDASIDLARGWLHDLANDFEALAISNAAATGPHWQQAMRDQANGGVA